MKGSRAPECHVTAHTDVLRSHGTGSHGSEGDALLPHFSTWLWDGGKMQNHPHTTSLQFSTILESVSSFPSIAQKELGIFKPTFLPTPF